MTAPMIWTILPVDICSFLFPGSGLSGADFDQRSFAYRLGQTFNSIQF